MRHLAALAVALALVTLAGCERARDACAAVERCASTFDLPPPPRCEPVASAAAGRCVVARPACFGGPLGGCGP